MALLMTVTQHGCSWLVGRCEMQPIREIYLIK